MGLLGLCLGSFFNVVVLRLPHIFAHQSALQVHDWLLEAGHAPAPDSALGAYLAPLLKPFSFSLPASHCPTCKTPLYWWHNIPVLSFLVLKGRCGHCSAPISWRYPLFELATGFGGALAGLWLFQSHASLFQILMVTWFAALTWVLLWVDLETMYLPDALTRLLLWGPLVLAALFEPSFQQVYNEWWSGRVGSGLVLEAAQKWVASMDAAASTGVLDHTPIVLESFATPVSGIFRLYPGGPLTSLSIMLVGVAVGFGTLWGIAALFKILRGVQAMGGGDIKLLAGVGAFLGAQGAIFVIFTAPFLGLVFWGACLIKDRINRNRHDTTIAPQDPESSAAIDPAPSTSQVMPYGPSLILAAWVYMAWGPALIQAWLNVGGY